MKFKHALEFIDLFIYHTLTVRDRKFEYATNHLTKNLTRLRGAPHTVVCIFMLCCLFST